MGSEHEILWTQDSCESVGVRAIYRLNWRKYGRKTWFFGENTAELLFSTHSPSRLRRTVPLVELGKIGIPDKARLSCRQPKNLKPSTPVPPLVAQGVREMVSF